MSIQKIIDSIISENQVPYKNYLTVAGNQLKVNITFSSRKKAENFAKSWSYNIKQNYSGAFSINMMFLENGDLNLLYKKYDLPNKAPELENINARKRPEKRINFI